MPDDYDIEAVREKYIGFETAPAQGRYPVEHDAIRRHCHMVDDNNPLFLDPEYAATTATAQSSARRPAGWRCTSRALGPWPAAFEPLFPMVPTRGKRIVNMSQEVEWFARIKVGDHLSVKRRVADVYEKAVSLDPLAVWIVAEAIISNQRDEIVCVIRKHAADAPDAGGDKRW